MILITYTGTIDEDIIDQEDKDELIMNILNEINNAVKEGTPEIMSFIKQNSKHLPEEKKIFTCLINLSPQHTDNEVIPSSSK